MLRKYNASDKQLLADIRFFVSKTPENPLNVKQLY